LDSGWAMKVKRQAHSASDRGLLAAITKAQVDFARNVPVAVVFEGLLGSLLEFTQSEYGFIGEVLYAEDGAPFLRTHAITDISWGAETRAFYEQNAATGLEFRNLETLFGRVIVSEAPLIANDPANHPDRGGLPDGHPAMRSFLGLPLRIHETLVGICGVANREGGYDQPIIDFVEPLLLTSATLIRAYRSRAEQELTERSLRESEARGRAIFEGTIEGIVTIDEVGMIEDLNKAALNLFGYSPQELIGQNVCMLMPEPHHSAHDGYLRAYLQTRQAKIIGTEREVRGRRKDGSLFPMTLGVSHVELEGRRFFTGVIRDISERKASEDELRRLNEQMATRLAELDRLHREGMLLAEMASFLQACEEEAEAFAILSEFGGLLLPGASGRFFEFVEGKVLERKEAWGEEASVLRFPSSECWALRRSQPHLSRGDGAGVSCSHLHLRSGESAICTPVMTRDGTLGLLTLRGNRSGEAGQGMAARGAGLDGAVGMLLRSVAERFGSALANIRLRRHLRDESIRDPLTGLFNRRFLDEVLSWELPRAERNGEPLSIVLADIDHFKSFNDEHGHDAGDLALCHVARTLLRAVRGEDIVCRYGGEEFVLLLGSTSLGNGLARAEAIREGIASSEILLPNGATRSIGLSLGVATFPDHGGCAADLLKRADEALYRAKEGGRNRVEAALPGFRTPIPHGEGSRAGLRDEMGESIPSLPPLAQAVGLGLAARELRRGR